MTLPIHTIIYNSGLSARHQEQHLHRETHSLDNNNYHDAGIGAYDNEHDYCTAQCSLQIGMRVVVVVVGRFSYAYCAIVITFKYKNYKQSRHISYRGCRHCCR